MARIKMDKVKVTKAVNRHCAICNVAESAEARAEAYGKELETLYPETEIPTAWRLEGNFGTDGYVINRLNYAPDNWNADGSGYSTYSSVFICKNCMEGIVKCVNAMETTKSEEISYSVRNSELFLDREWEPKREEEE